MDYKKMLMVLIILALALYMPTVTNRLRTVEKWDNKTRMGPEYTDAQTGDCYNLKDKDCVTASNCGLCMKGDTGKLECVPGDDHGPYFKSDCLGWITTNYYDRHLYGERVVRGYPPWNMFYPPYEARYPSPLTRATLL